MAVNKVILVGNLGHDPSLREFEGGKVVTSFSIATTEKWTDKSGERKEQTEWHKIVAWDKLAKICKEYLTKGSQVYLEGKLQTRKYTGKDGVEKFTTEVLASSVQFLNVKQKGESKPGEPTASMSSERSWSGEDDIPY